jgi:hypothetical protein
LQRPAMTYVRARRPARPPARPRVPAVAPAVQPPAERPLPVAADTHRRRQCPRRTPTVQTPTVRTPTLPTAPAVCGSSSRPPRCPRRPVRQPPRQRPRCPAAWLAAAGRRRTRSRHSGTTSAPRRLRLLVCAGHMGQVDVADGFGLSGRADTGGALPDAGSPPASALRTPRWRHAGQPAAEPSTTAAMSDGNGTAVCRTGQHPCLTARSLVWGGRKASVVRVRQRSYSSGNPTN